MVRMGFSLAKQISISNLGRLSFDTVEFPRCWGVPSVPASWQCSGAPRLSSSGLSLSYADGDFSWFLGSSSADRIPPGVCPNCFVMSEGPSSRSAHDNNFVRSFQFSGSSWLTSRPEVLEIFLVFFFLRQLSWPCRRTGLWGLCDQEFISGSSGSTDVFLCFGARRSHV